MKYIECPEVYEGKEKSLFIAGGISNCPNWQREFAEMLRDEDITCLNPRRKNFPMGDPNASVGQIKWEHDHLKKARAISFWFPKETLCPITLFELGKQADLDKPLFLGVHPEYARKLDVRIQMMLERPEVKIVYSLGELADQVKNWAREQNEN